MARPGQIPIIQLDRRPSRTSAFIDAATAAVQLYADKKKQQHEEDVAVAQLAPWISSLDPKQQTAFMSKLSMDNPKVAARVAQMIGPGVTDPEETAARDWRLSQIGYNPNPTIHMERAAPPPPPPSPMGMIGMPQVGNPLGVSASTMPQTTPYDPNRAVSPTPAGYTELPKDPAERAHMLSLRDVAAFGKEVATEPWVNLNVRRALPSEEQLGAIRIAAGTEPTGSAKTVAEASRFSAEQRVNAARIRTAGTAANEASREAARVTVEEMKAARAERTSALKDLQAQVRANQSEARRITRELQTGKADSTQALAQIRDLNAKNAVLLKQISDLRSAPVVTKTAPAPKPKKDSLGIL